MYNFDRFCVMPIDFLVLTKKINLKFEIDRLYDNSKHLWLIGTNNALTAFLKGSKNKYT